MLIPINSRCALTPQRLAEQLEVDVHSIDAGLNIKQTEDKALGMAILTLTRQHRPRPWRILIFADGSGALNHPKKGHTSFGTVRAMHSTVLDIVRSGHD